MATEYTTPTRSDSIGVRVGRLLFFVGAIATVVTALVTFLLARGTLQDDAYKRLSALRVVTKDSVETYFAGQANTLTTLAESVTAQNALSEFSQARRDLDQDIAAAGFTPDDVFIAGVNREVARYYEDKFLLPLKSVRGAEVPSVLSFIHSSPSTNLLQYVYIVKNGAASGAKDTKTTATDIKAYDGIEPVFADAFSKTAYVKAHDSYHAILNSSRLRAGLEDLYVVDTDGYVVYSSAKKLDFAGDLKAGPQRATGLGEAFAKALAGKPGETFVTDLMPYALSFDAPSGFISTPIAGADGQVQGVLISQISSTALNGLVTFKGQPQEVNLGSTGEAYLIADQGGTPFMRSDSRFIGADDSLKTIKLIKGAGTSGEIVPVASTITGQPVTTADGLPTAGAKAALEGTSGVGNYTNYLGKGVLGSYDKLDVPGLNWGILVEQATGEAFAPATRISVGILIVGAIVLLAIIALSVYVARDIARPIQSLEEAMNLVASGKEDARAEVVGRDEIAALAATFNRLNADRLTNTTRANQENERLQHNIEDLLLVVADASDGKLGVRARVTEGALGNIASALNIMLENVGEFIEQIRKASSRVASASVEIATSAGDLTRGVSQQTEQLQSSVSELQELAKGSRQVSATSTDANAAALQTRSAAEQGQEAVSQVQLTMEQIREKVQVNAQKIKRLGERSMEISGIVKSISDISAQTDMLAFNASVESERGGEGRGFNLVADRVRDLAERTKQATMEIERLVAGIQTETAEAVVQMERMTQEVENGSGKVGAAAEALQNIVKSSIRSSELVADISQIAKVQDEEAQHLLEAVTNVNQIVERARQKVLESRRTSEQLAELSSDLNERISVFDTTGLAQA
jgi:methyl-accepting chemotaxis protein